MREAGVEDIVDSMLSLFMGDAPGRLDAIRASCSQGDGPATGAAAHAFKSAAGTIFAMPLFELLRAMEFAGKNHDVERCRSLLPDVTIEYEAVMGFLESMQADTPPATWTP